MTLTHQNCRYLRSNSLRIHNNDQVQKIIKLFSISLTTRRKIYKFNYLINVYVLQEDKKYTMVLRISKSY